MTASILNNPLRSLALMLAGYSMVCAVAIAVVHFSGDEYRDRRQAQTMGLLLVAALVTLQAGNFAWLENGAAWVNAAPYRIALFVVAPCFYVFSRSLLRPMQMSTRRGLVAVHALPALVAPWLTPEIARPAAFALGAAYLLGLGRGLFALRQERGRFLVEATLLGAAFAIACAVAILALVPSLLGENAFLEWYATAIGMGFLLVQIALWRRPQLPAEVREAVQSRYVSTSLAKVDCDAAIARLEDLMRTQRLFSDPELSLGSLADRVGLGSHQLSELLNSRLGKSYSRYLRELRVAAARTMLRDEPSASVLSVGLSVGFTSQSTFYEAFREIEGTTPGQFRRLLPGR